MGASNTYSKRQRQFEISGEDVIRSIATYSLPTTRKTVSPMKMSNFKMSKLTNHEVYKKLVLTIFT